MSSFNTPWAILGIAAAIAFGVAFPADANARYGYYGCGAGWGGPALTLEQQASAQKIFNETFASTQNIREELAAKRAEMDALLASSNPDNVRIQNLAREIGELRGQMLSKRVEVRSKLEKAGIPTDFYGINCFAGNGGWHHGAGSFHPCQRW